MTKQELDNITKGSVVEIVKESIGVYGIGNKYMVIDCLINDKRYTGHVKMRCLNTNAEVAISLDGLVNNFKLIS